MLFQFHKGSIKTVEEPPECYMSYTIFNSIRVRLRPIIVDVIVTIVFFVSIP